MCVCPIWLLSAAHGVVLLNTGRYDDAIVHLNEVVKAHPDLVGAYHTRGAAYAKKGVRVRCVFVP